MLIKVNLCHKNLKGIKWDKMFPKKIKNQEYVCLMHGKVNHFAKAYKWSWLAVQNKMGP